MKIGDRFEVGLKDAGQYFDVAEGYIENIEEGIATIVIPATRVQVKVKESLDMWATKETDGPDRVFGGFEDSTPSTSEAQEEVNLKPTDVGEGIHGKELDSSALD